MLNGWRYEDGSEVEAFGHQTAALVRLNSGGEAGISYTVLQEIPDTYSLFFRADCHSAELFVNGESIYSFHAVVQHTSEKDRFREFSWRF